MLLSNGLQIQLEGTQSDTLVMQNLGAAAASSQDVLDAVDASAPAQATSSSAVNRARGK